MGIMTRAILEVMVQDYHLIERAALVAKSLGVNGALQWAARSISDLAATPIWIEVYAAAGGEPEGDPAAHAPVVGADPDVITDALILEAVEALLAESPA